MEDPCSNVSPLNSWTVGLRDVASSSSADKSEAVASISWAVGFETIAVGTCLCLIGKGRPGHLMWMALAKSWPPVGCHRGSQPLTWPLQTQFSGGLQALCLLPKVTGLK